MREFIAIRRAVPGGFFGIGDHKVKIEAIGPEESRPVTEWSDKTPQVKVTYRNDEGVLSQWFNLKGFEKLDVKENPDAIAPKGFEYRQASDKDGNGIGAFYLVDKKTNERVENLDATEIATGIFCDMAIDAGIDNGGKFTFDSLEGKELGIRVRARGTSVEVHHTMPADKVKVPEELAS